MAHVGWGTPPQPTVTKFRALQLSIQGAPWQQAAPPTFFMHSLREMQRLVYLGSTLLSLGASQALQC